jgi:hypothetical protein
VQGRLNYEGTRHIPILNALFAAPVEDRSAGSATPPPPPARVPAAVETVPQPAAADQAPVGKPGAEAVPSPAGMPAGRGFRTGQLFDLARIEAAGLTVAEINAIVEQARADRRQLAAERAELRRQRLELEMRERDVEERRQLQEVVAERGRLEQAVREFNARVTEIRIDEMAALEEAARSIARLTPAAGAELMVEFWQGDDGPNKVVKLLAVMAADRADEILACLDTRRAREILEKRMTVIRPRATEAAGKHGDRR